MDYSSDADRSWVMFDLLRGMLDAWGHQEGEAAAELLLAVATSRLRLESSVEVEFLDFLNQLDDLPPLLALLCEYIQEVLRPAEI